MRVARVLIVLFCALAQSTLRAQEPETPTPAPTPAPEAQEEVTEQMVLDAIEKLRGTYDLADERVREGVETPAPGAQARGAALRPAVEAVDELVADMEALLALLPKPPPPPSSSSSQQPKDGQPNPDGKPQNEQDRPGSDPRDPRAGDREDQSRTDVPPPNGALLDGMLPAAYARWGLLPPRLQEALRSSSASDVPLRYRRWLEQYHRRGVAAPR